MAASVRDRMIFRMEPEFRLNWRIWIKLSKRPKRKGNCRSGSFYLAYLDDPAGIGIGLVQSGSNDQKQQLKR